MRDPKKVYVFEVYVFFWSPREGNTPSPNLSYTPTSRRILDLSRSLDLSRLLTVLIKPHFAQMTQ